MKENQLVKVLVLLITFISSQPLLWKIIEAVCGEDDIYVVQQFMFASFFAMFSIWLTDDINLLMDSGRNVQSEKRDLIWLRYKCKNGFLKF